MHAHLHDIFGELNLKTGKGEVNMQGEDFITMMVVAMDRMIQERENTVELEKAIEMVMGISRQFNGKYVS